ncbi:hypothetical protein MTO96_018671 [Rhipicephalus appendiculatus]
MCTVTLRQSAIFTVVCLPWYSYIPDVHNVSRLVSQESSDQITIVLSGASMFFDVLMFGGCVSKIPQLLDAGCLWHYFDLGADLIVGFASANYSRPTITINVTDVAPVQPSLRGGLALRSEAAPRVLDAANATVDDGAAKRSPAAANSHRGKTVVWEGDKDNPYNVLLEPPTVRQFLHFLYVIFRAIFKCQMLGMYGVFVRHYKN